MQALTTSEHWQSAKLGDVCNIIMGQSPPSSAYNEEGVGMPFLQGKAEFTELFPLPTKYCTESLRIAPQGSVLMSVRAPVGNVNLADRKYVIGRGLTSISLKEGDNRFILYSLLYRKKELEAQSYGSTFKAINKTTVTNFRIPLPPLPEQRAIASVLSAIQEAKFARQKEIALERERKAALMDHLFSHGTKGEPRKRTEIGEFPESWEVVSLGEVTDIFKGGTPKRSVEKYFQGNIPWAIPTDITALGSAIYIDDTATHISEEALGKSAARLLPAGTVLLTSRATIGETAIPTTPMATNQGFANFLCKDVLLNVYLAYYLRYVKRRLIDLASGSTFKEVTKGTLLKIQIPLPPLPEQNVIAEILKAFDAKIALLEQETVLLDELFHAMLEELMTGKRSAVPLIDAELPK